MSVWQTAVICDPISPPGRSGEAEGERLISTHEPPLNDAIDPQPTCTSSPAQHEWSALFLKKPSMFECVPSSFLSSSCGVFTVTKERMKLTVVPNVFACCRFNRRFSLWHPDLCYDYYWFCSAVYQFLYHSFYKNNHLIQPTLPPVPGSASPLQVEVKTLPCSLVILCGFHVSLRLLSEIGVHESVRTGFILHDLSYNQCP